MEVNIYAAKTHLSRLIDQVNAGEEVIITRHGRAVARLVAADPAKLRKLGLLEGQGYWVADDFDAPLPDDLLDLFEGKAKEPGTEGP
jgi:prevent-host-death family protein